MVSKPHFSDLFLLHNEARARIRALTPTSFYNLVHFTFANLLPLCAVIT